MKAQLFSIDLLVALTIFFTVIALVAYFWLVIPSTRSYDVQEKANLIAGFLVSKKLGDENVLECSKVTELASKDCSTIKSELNANPYNISLEFKNTTATCNGNKININCTSSSTFTASVVRVVYLNGQKMQMVVRLYD